MATRKKQPVKAAATGEAAAAKRTHRLGHRVAALKLPRHGAFYFALGVGVVVFFLTLWLAPTYSVVAGSITMFVIYLTLIGALMPVLTADMLRSRAEDADTPSGVIFLVVIGVVAFCSGTLFMALNGKHGPAAEQVILSIVSVLLGWFVIQTMAAMHYAFEYYQSEITGQGGSFGDGPRGGLDFPEGDSPDGVAFIYFAYVIGTAFAVSDIRVTSRKMRKFVLIHSTFAYFFNTLIVAATVNVAVAVGGSGG